MAVLSIIFMAFACTPKSEVKDNVNQNDTTLVADSAAVADTVVTE